MNDFACKNLQIIWEELQHFSFDLTWLKPHVDSALGMRSYLMKLEEAKKLKDNVIALELEMETHKDTLVALDLEMRRVTSRINTLELNLDAARDLLIAEELEEVDLEAELGFVKS
ncbi:unnamed protein product [Lathyrus sativus]|nr:unnamed protein product [Lathyrus sativus]